MTLNHITTFFTAFVIGVFEVTISKVVMLVVFLPVVARQAGIGGTRSGTWVNRRIGGIYMEREFYSGSSICFAMIGTMFIAGLVGAGIPNGTHKIGN